jgi:hypothetical protein
LLEAASPLIIAKERFVDGPLESVISQIASAAADDQIKIIASRNGIGANATYPYNGGTPSQGDGQTLEAYIDLAPLTGMGATLGGIETAWKTVLAVMQERALSSAQNGVYIAFDIVSPTPDTLAFRTFAQYRGVDHRFPTSQNPVIFGGEFGNVGQATMRIDYGKEITYATAAGPGQGSGQMAGYAYDNTRIGASPFGRRMGYVTYSYPDQTALDNLASAAVRYGRARYVYRGRLLSTPDTRYGVHWGWGDFVTVQDFGKSFDCRVDAVTVTVEKNKETIDAWGRSD